MKHDRYRYRYRYRTESFASSAWTRSTWISPRTTGDGRRRSEKRDLLRTYTASGIYVQPPVLKKEKRTVVLDAALDEIHEDDAGEREIEVEVVDEEAVAAMSKSKSNSM